MRNCGKTLIDIFNIDNNTSLSETREMSEIVCDKRMAVGLKKVVYKTIVTPILLSVERDLGPRL